MTISFKGNCTQTNVEIALIKRVPFGNAVGASIEVDNPSKSNSADCFTGAGEAVAETGFGVGFGEDAAELFLASGEGDSALGLATLDSAELV